MEFSEENICCNVHKGYSCKFADCIARFIFGVFCFDNYHTLNTRLKALIETHQIQTWIILKVVLDDAAHEPD